MRRVWWEEKEKEEKIDKQEKPSVARSEGLTMRRVWWKKRSFFSAQHRNSALSSCIDNTLATHWQHISTTLAPH